MKSMTTKAGGLANQYSKLADDVDGDGTRRNAAMLFSLAEGYLNEQDDYDKAIDALREALPIFKGLDDRVATADVLRLLIRAYIVKAANQTGLGLIDEDERTDLLEEALSIATEELSLPQFSGDRRGEGILKLVVADIGAQASRIKPDAIDNALGACNLFRSINDRKMEAYASMTVCSVCVRMGEATKAVEAATSALPILRDLGDGIGEGMCLHALAHACQKDGAFDNALQAASEAVELFRELGAKRWEGVVLLTIAEWQIFRHEPEEALITAKEAAQIFQQFPMSKDREIAATCSAIEAQVATGDVDEAIAFATRQLKIFNESGERMGEVVVLRQLVYAHLTLDEFDDAVDACEAAVDICRQLPDRAQLAGLLLLFADVLEQSQQPERAVDAAKEAIMVYQEVGNTEEIVIAMHVLSSLHLKSGCGGPELQRVAQEAYEFFHHSDNMLGEAFAMITRTYSMLLNDDLDNAEATAKEAQEMFRQCGHREGETTALNVMVKVCKAKEEYQRSIPIIWKKVQIWRDIGRRTMEAEALIDLSQMSLLSNDYKQAMRSAREAEGVSRAVNDTHGQVCAMFALIEVCVGMCQPDSGGKFPRDYQDTALKAMRLAKMQ